MNLQFRDIIEDDLEIIIEIFNYYILQTIKNYRTHPLTISDLKEILQPGHSKYKSCMILENGKPCGFVYLSQFRKREAYDRTAEVTVYLSPEHTGKGIGKRSLKYIESMWIFQSRGRKIWEGTGYGDLSKKPG